MDKDTPSPLLSIRRVTIVVLRSPVQCPPCALDGFHNGPQISLGSSRVLISAYGFAFRLPVADHSFTPDCERAALNRLPEIAGRQIYSEDPQRRSN